MIEKSIVRILILLSLFLIGITPSSAMSAEDGDTLIRGKVVSGHEHKAVSGARVEIILGHKVYSQGQSGEEGEFALALPKGNKSVVIIRISHLSFETLIKRIGRIGTETDLGTLLMMEKQADLSEFVVTSTRSTRHFTEVPVRTQLISSSQIARIAPVTLKDVLLYSIPGIEVSQHGGSTRLMIQGYEAAYFTFLIDGEELAGLNSDGTPDLTRLSPDNIEKVEVIKGAGSALYGSNAVGGVINFITKQQSKPLSLYASSGYVSTGGWDGYLEAGIKREKWSNAVTASLAREASYPVQNREGSQQITVLRSDIVRAGNKFRWTPSEHLKLNWDASFLHRRQHRDEFRHDMYDYLTNNIKATYGLSDKGKLTATYNSDLSWRDRIYPKDKSASRETIHKNYKHLLRFQYDRHLGEGNDLSLGIEGHGEHMLSYQIKSATAPKNIMYGVIFGQHLWRLAKGLDLMYGLRADIHSTYGLHLSPKATLSYKRSGWIFRGGYAQAFKSPTVMELYFDWFHGGGSGFMIHGNPDLKPEKATQLLAGVEWSNARLSLSAGITHTIFRDRISMYVDEKNERHYTNIDGTRKMTTADAQMTWRPCNGLTIGGSYVFTHNPNYQVINGVQVNLNDTRPHNLMMRVETYKAWYSKWSCSATLMGQYLSDIDRTTVNPTTLQTNKQHFEGYSMFRASASVSYDNRATLTVGADNLLNYKADNINFQNASLSPGRILFTKLSLRLP